VGDHRRIPQTRDGDDTLGTTTKDVMLATAGDGGTMDDGGSNVGAADGGIAICLSRLSPHRSRLPLTQWMLAA
jgi:hypothetical protein